MKKLKVAIIGVGNMGMNHFRVYLDLPDAELVAISDLSEKPSRDLAQKHRINWYFDFKEMLEKEKPEIVSICVPTSQHYWVAKECISKGVNVLLEKPITDDIARAQELLGLAKEREIKFLVGHTERFNPIIRRIKEIIRREQVGRIIAIVARRVGAFPPQIKDVNVAVDLAIHDIDICNYLMEQLPIGLEINAQKNLIKNREDSVEFFLRYGNGSSAYIQANWITPVKIRKLNITGEKGYLEADYINQEIDFYQSNYTKSNSSKNLINDILNFSEPDKMKIIPAKKEPLKEEITYFIGCIKNNKEINSQFAIDSLRIALGQI